MKPTKTLACASALMMLLGSAAYAQTSTTPSTTSPGTTGAALTAEQCKMASNIDKPECAKYQAQAPSSSTKSPSSTGSSGSMGSGSSSGSSGSSSMGSGSSGSSSTGTKTK